MVKFENLDLLQIGNTIQLVGAVWAGNGQMYLCMFPEEHGGVYPGDATMVCFQGDAEIAANRETDVATLNMSSAEWEQFLRQTDILETEVLAKAADDKVTKAILRKTSRQIAQTISWEVFHRDDFKCRYCGRGPGIPLTVDHLVLWESGGPSTENNLVSSCRRCNKTRGNTEYADWLKHPYYQKVSGNLTATVRQDNIDLAATLDAIPRMVHKQSKRK